MRGCAFNTLSTKRAISLLAFTLVVWSIIVMIYVYESLGTHNSQVYSNQTYRAELPLESTRIKAGAYSLDVIQPVTVFGRVEYLTVNYKITKTIDSNAWVASRKITVNGAVFDIGADVFRTKLDALTYISKTGRYIDYGKDKNIGIGGIR